MAKLNEFVKDYIAPVFKNISEIDRIPVDVEIIDKLEEYDGKEKLNHYITLSDIEYRMPVPVIKQLQEQLKANPEMKAFSVSKTGEGIATSYVVIPILN